MTGYIFFTLILSYLLLSISKDDLDSMLISENKLRILTLFGAIYLAFLGFSNEKINIIDLFLDKLLAMLIIFFIMFSISYISFKLFKINSLGFGDIKLSSISSIWLGIEMTIISLCISFLLSALYSLHRIITNRFRRFDQYPFAPFLSIGIFISWVLAKI